MSHLSDLNYQDLKQFLTDSLELDKKNSSMRANQIWKVFYQKGFADYKLFSNIPSELKEKLSGQFSIGRPIIKKRMEQS